MCEFSLERKMLSKTKKRENGYFRKADIRTQIVFRTSYVPDSDLRFP